MGGGHASWNDVVADPRLKVRPNERNTVLSALSSLGAIGTAGQLPIPKKRLLKRLLEWAPCLYTQLNIRTSADAIVHLCEITLGAKIVSANVHDAFVIQHPNDTTKTFSIAPQFWSGNPGDISEALCSEVLTNEGLPKLELDATGWPIYNRIGHIRLNKGKMIAVKAFGDILIPCAPSNLIISVKTETAKERLLYSANMIEGIGFGFFNSATEFWTPSRMNLYKRMGFTAIYLPDSTHAAIHHELNQKGIKSLAINVNGKQLYRPLTSFGEEMKNVAGKHSLHL